MIESFLPKKIISVREAIHDQLESSVALSTSKYRTTVRLIFGSLNKRSFPIGTAFFLNYEEESYVVTAAHVMDHHKNGAALFVACPQPWSLAGTVWSTLAPAGERKNDRLDLAFRRLSSDEIERHQSDGGTFVSHPSDVIPQQHQSKGRVYLALGFPNSRNRVNPTKVEQATALLKHYDSGQPIESPSLRAVGIDDDVHIAIRYDDKVRIGFDTSKDSVHPRGTSGGILIDLGTQTFDSMTSGQFPGHLAGMVIERRPTEVGRDFLISVRVHRIIDAIKKSLE
jgi:hypothetical protein